MNCDYVAGEVGNRTGNRGGVRLGPPPVPVDAMTWRALGSSLGSLRVQVRLVLL